MPEQIQTKMNGVIPSIPVTTLAGIASLSDLLTEMPLPTPLPQTMSNKSLLFHPRVADEAQILLSSQDENLVPQLIMSLSQTSSDHIELKDHYANLEQPLEAQQNPPELLKAILQTNPHVFKGPQYNSPRNWPQQQSHQMTGNYEGFSPSYSSSSNSRQTPQDSPAHMGVGRTMLPGGIPHAQHPSMPVAPQNHTNVTQSSPFTVPSPSPRATVITEQTRTSTTPQHLMEDTHSFNNIPTQFDMHSPAHMSTPSPLISSLGNVTPQHHTMSSGLTPQHSMHMTPPTDSGLSATQHHQVQPQHHVQQQHPLHQPHQMQQQMNVHQQMFDPMMNRQLHQPQLSQALDIDHTLHDNQQFVLDQVTGLPDIDIPIGSLDASHSRELMSNPMTGSQANVFDSVNTGANLNNAMVPLPDSAPPIPQSQQGHIPFEQTLHQQHHLQPTLQQHQAQQAFQVNQMQLQQAQQMQQQQQHLQHPQHQQQQVMQPNSNLERDIKISLKEPVIMLNRSLADQALMKKHLNASNEKSPARATRTSLSSRDDKSIKSESDSEEEIGKNNKCFKSKAKDRQRDKSDKKKSADEKRSSLARRKRLIDSDDEDEKDKKDEVFSPVKPKIRKFEKKLVPVLPKLSVEELMETNTYQRFNMLVETIFENTEDAALDEIEEDGDVPAELLINDHQLQALCSEAAKLKSLGAMESVPAEKLVRLLNILEKNIRDGARVSPLADPDDDAEQSRMWMQIAMSRVQQAVDASLVCLHIMTSSNMPKTIYLEDVIDRIIQFVKFQLQNTIYPSYDPVYRIDSKNKTESFNASGRKKRSHAKEVREKNMLMVFSKLNELVGLLSELLGIQILTDTSVLHASTLGVAPFFVENVNDLQLSALKLVTVIFTKYEKHRRLLLDDILASIARLPSSKHSLRTYRLSTDEHIQMLTALVLQLIQCVVVLPEGAVAPGSGEEQRRELSAASGAASGPDVDVLILSKYDAAQRLAGNFLTAFLNKCGSKGEEVDYRPLFENFVQDLLATVNKPEWPAAELMLSLLGKLLVGHFSNKSSDMSLRVASIEYLGVVAARLRKDAVSSHCKLSTIDQIINDIKHEQSRDIEYDQVKDRDIAGLSEPEERVVFLQKVLLDYLAVNGTKDSALGYARHFYLAQWYKDCAMEKQRVGQPKHHVLSPSKKAARKRTIKKSGSRRRVISDDESELEQSEPEPIENDAESEQKHSEIYRLIEERKRLIISKIRPYSSGAKADILQTYIDYNTAELITQYLASTRPFSQSFDRYLRDILCVLTESSIAIRTKAMKCLTMIVEADPSVLARSDMALGVKHSFLDHSTSVREAAVDLVGKFVLSRPELIDKYYDILLARILDTGVSVRKRVIKILKDICMEFPDYEKIPEICVKMIRRVNDEEGIRKLVMEVFQNMWFTPIKERPSLDTKALLRKVMNITDVVAACKDIGLEWFEQLLVSLFKPKEDKEDSTKLITEPPKALLTACTQIVDCLIENVLRLEETEMPSPELSADEPGPPATLRRGASQRLVACLTTLYLFAKIRPQLLVNHAITLQPYLSLKCQTQGDYQIISSVAHTLELVVPLMEHPSETFLAQLEEDSVKLILQHDRSVVASCVSCLGSIVNSVTRNYKLIRDCFKKYYDGITTYKKHYELNPESQWLARNKPFFRRALFTVGLLLRHFDFTDPQVIEGFEPDIKDQVFNTLNFFVTQDNDDTFTLSAIGSLCIRHYEFMMLPQLEELYHYFLTSDIAPVQMRIQVLKNIELYLAEEEKRMIKQDLEWAKMSKKENLKEMGDVSSGMASAVIQRYLKQILESFLHANINVRHSALKVIQLILAQGLVHPVTIVPYLICMSTDCETMVSHSADKQLQEIEKKYPGFVHTKAQVGIKLSFRLQQILQKESRMVRGMRTKEGEYPTALNGFLYTILRNTKQQRRAIVQSFLKQFDESVKTSLSQLLYLADNLAYFSYQVQDEPLFIIHHIDIIISMSGTNLLQDFKKALIPKENSSNQAKQETAQQPTVHGDQQPPPQEQQQQQQQQQEHQFQQPLPQQQQYSYPQPPMFYPQGGEIPLPNEIAAGMPSVGLAYQAVLHPTHLPLGQERPQQIQQPKPSLFGPDGRPRPDQLLAAIEDEEDDEEDEESVLQRLPQDTRILRQHITASQGFLLLLNLRQHLKDLYGFSDAKISQYSPSESAKVYEKAVNRKNNQMFKPKNTLQRLKENKNDEQELDEPGRQQLVKEYLDFKQLVLKFDPDEPEDEDEEGGVSKSKRGDHENSKIANSSEPDRTADGAPLVQYQVHQVTEHPNNSMTQAQGPPRVPKLTIHASHHPASTEKEHHRKHRTHKTEKPKKHKKKKRRRLSDSSDSAEDCSDPDYHA